MKVTMLLATAMLLSAAAWAQDQVMGLWLTEQGESVVEVYRAADGTCGGRVVWLKEQRDANGEELRDVMNGNPCLRSRRVLGLEVLRGYRNDGDTWRSGTIYNWRNGNSYNSKMYLEDGRLHVKGYYSLLFFLGRTKVWTRVTDPSRYGLR
jgi:uncharacterized protein (DUF2147 family)